MKRFYIFPLLCLFLLISCDDGLDEAEYSNELKVDITNPVSLTKDAQSYEIWFETNCEWTASIETSDGGMTISPTSGSNGTNAVILELEENTLYDSRTGTVTVSVGTLQQSVSITQAAGVDIMEVDTEEIYFEAAGGTQVVSVTNNMSYELELADDEATWLTFPATKAYGVDGFTFTAETNYESALRTNTVYITGTSDFGVVYQDSVVVYQKPANVIGLSSCDFIDLPSDGDTIYVTCSRLYETSNLLGTIVETYSVDTVDWVAATVFNGDVDADTNIAVDTLVFVIEANDTGLDRILTLQASKATRTVLAEATDSTVVQVQTVTEYQDLVFSQVYNKVLTYNGTSEVKSDGGSAATLYLSITKNIDVEVIIPDDMSDWLSVGEITNSTIELFFEENGPDESRSGTITVVAVDDEEMSFEVLISQDKMMLLEGITPTGDVECSVDGEVLELTVMYNDTPDDEYTLASWISLSGISNVGLDEYQYTYSFTVTPFIPDDTNPYYREDEVYFARSAVSDDSLKYNVYQSYVVDCEAATSGNKLGTALFNKYGSFYNTELPSLKVVGSVNSDELAGIAAMKGLTRLDLSECTVPNNEIPAGLFKGNTNLVLLSLPEDLVTIGESAFEGCSSLKGDLVIPDWVTSVGAYAFKNCSSLDGSLTLSSSLVTIGEEAFYGCSSLTGQLYLYNSLLTIAPRAFMNCSSLNGLLKLSRSVEVIEESVFEGCSSLVSGLYIPSCVTEIQAGAFKGCSGMAGTITLEEPLAIIGESAFEDCSGLTGDLVLPNSVISIGKAAFKGCASFTSLTLSEGMSEVPAQAFANCKSIATTVTIDTNITSIGDFAFYKCSGMTGKLTLHTRLTSIGEYAFYGCSLLNSAFAITYSVESIGKYAFAYCATGGVVSFSSANNKITTLEEGTFMNSGYTGSLTLYSPISVIKENAISGTTQAGTLTFSAGITTIEKQASIAATALKFNWISADAIPADLQENLLDAIDSKYAVGTTDGYIIYIPVGTTTVYEDLLAAYTFEEVEE